MTLQLQGGSLRDEGEHVIKRWVRHAVRDTGELKRMLLEVEYLQNSLIPLNAKVHL